MRLQPEPPAHLHDLLRLTRAGVGGRIDFGNLTRDPTSYVQRDSCQVEAGLVFRAAAPGRAVAPAGVYLYLYRAPVRAGRADAAAPAGLRAPGLQGPGGRVGSGPPDARRHPTRAGASGGLS